MIDFLQAILLGALQGVTEWLPISSSGHLVIAQQLLGVSPPLAFDVALHFGTIIAAIYFFKQEIKEMLAALVERRLYSREAKLAYFLVLTTIPTAVIGFAFHDLFQQMFSSVFTVGIALLLTGGILWLAERKQNKEDVDGKKAFWIGVAQGIAVAPGISRSGATIGAGMFLGVERKKAAKYSFLAAIPAIIGASVFELGNVAFDSSLLLPSIVGAVVAGVVGFASMKWLLDFVARNKLTEFAYYCWAIGLAIILFSVVKA